MKKKVLLSSLLVCICVFTGYADKTLYIDPVDGSDLKNGSSWENAIRSINLIPNMLDAEGVTTVELKENSLFENVDNIDFGSVNINLVINGNNATIKGKTSEKRMFRVAGPESILKFNNITFRDKTTENYNMGAVIIFVGKEITVENCQFINNASQCGGSALGCRAEQVTVRNSYFKDNKTTLNDYVEGAAILQGGRRGVLSYLLVENCTFDNNTVLKGDGSAIGFYDRSGNGQANVGDLCEVKIFNCAFFENKAVQPTSGNVGAAVHFDYNMQYYGNKVPIDGVLVNNTFYGSAPAVSIENQNKVLFINNVAFSYDDSSTSAPLLKTDFNTNGQTTRAYNNVLIALKMPASSREPDFVTGNQGNLISQSLSDFANLGMDDYLTKASSDAPFFVPYIAINNEASPLIDAGLERGEVFFFGEEVVPETDIRGQARADAEAESGTKPDVGAYEWGNGTIKAGLANVSAPDELFMLYQSKDEVFVISKANRPLSLQVVQLDGRVITRSTLNGSLTLKRNEISAGVKIFVVSDGQKTVARKVLL
ncbi:MAG: right-handed parallel beta-helix repeat-containing protein [Dysgonamonadaceae bacterium]|jgi:hypothetical protein|nr:right-handed parallel beta-helix repeat-containing protein [Dysgonamonadaceae bacterium]